MFTEEIEQADVAISDGFIVGIGTYEGDSEIDLKGKYVCPGFLDGHIHLESSMVSPAEFQQAVLPHGTTGVITDPHELANVAELMNSYGTVRAEPEVLKKVTDARRLRPNNQPK